MDLARRCLHLLEQEKRPRFWRPVPATPSGRHDHRLCVCSDDYCRVRSLARPGASGRRLHSGVRRPCIGPRALDPRLLADGTVIDAQPNAPLLNSQHGYARGVEVYVQRRTANGFTGWISYSYARALETDDVLGLKFPSDYDQRHTINAYASRRI